jgi:hypothetical protein
VRKRTLIKLSIAAVAMLTVAVPSFGQEAAPSFGQEQVGESKTLAAPGSGLELALNLEPRTTVSRSGLVALETKTVSDAASITSVTPPVTLVTLKSSQPFSFVKRTDPLASPAIRFEGVSSFSSKPRFRADYEGGEEPAKQRVTFVPSRGQKIPG